MEKEQTKKMKIRGREEGGGKEKSREEKEKEKEDKGDTTKTIERQTNEQIGGYTKHNILAAVLQPE